MLTPPRDLRPRRPLQTRLFGESKGCQAVSRKVPEFHGGLQVCADHAGAVRWRQRLFDGRQPCRRAAAFPVRRARRHVHAGDAAHCRKVFHDEPCRRTNFSDASALPPTTKAGGCCACSADHCQSRRMSHRLGCTCAFQPEAALAAPHCPTAPHRTSRRPTRPGLSRSRSRSRPRFHLMWTRGASPRRLSWRRSATAWLGRGRTGL